VIVIILRRRLLVLLLLLLLLRRLALLLRLLLLALLLLLLETLLLLLLLLLTLVLLEALLLLLLLLLALLILLEALLLLLLLLLTLLILLEALLLLTLLLLALLILEPLLLLLTLLVLLEALLLLLLLLLALLVLEARLLALLLLLLRAVHLLFVVATLILEAALAIVIPPHRPLLGRMRRVSIVVAEVGVALLHGAPLVVALEINGIDVAITFRPAFALFHGMTNATRAAIESYMAITLDKGAIVVTAIAEGKVNARSHAEDFRVVVEVVATPLPAFKADTEVAAAIVNTAVVAHVVAPVAGAPHIHTIRPSPIARRPQSAHIRGRNPGAGHPVIALFTISPVARRPDPSRLRAGGHIVNRQNRRCEIHTDKDSCKRSGRNHGEHKRHKQQAERAKLQHKHLPER